MSVAGTIRRLQTRQGLTPFLVRHVLRTDDPNGGYLNRAALFGPFQGSFIDPTFRPPNMPANMPGDIRTDEGWRLYVLPLRYDPQPLPDGSYAAASARTDAPALLTLNDSDPERDRIESEGFGDFQVLKVHPFPPVSSPPGYMLVLEKYQ